MSPPSRLSTVVNFSLLIVCVIIFLNIGRFFQIDEAWYQSLLTGVPLLVSGGIFIILYVVLTSLIWIGPKDFFRLSSALIYGAYISTVLVYIGEVINAVIIFTLSRKLGRGFVESKLKGRMKQLDQTFADASFWWIFTMRLFVVPFRFLDMGCGLTPIPLRKYLLIVVTASPVRLFLFQYLLTLGADMIRDPLRLAEHLADHPWILGMNFVYAVGIVFVLFLLKKRGVF